MPSWNVIAIQVEPQIATQAVKSWRLVNSVAPLKTGARWAVDALGPRLCGDDGLRRHWANPTWSRMKLYVKASSFNAS